MPSRSRYSSSRVALAAVLVVVLLPIIGIHLARAVDFSRGDAIEPVREDTLLHAKGRLRPEQDSEEANSWAAEAYVQRAAFEPGGNDLAFITAWHYPHARALFHLEVDDVSGEVAPTSTLLSGLPEEVWYFNHDIQSSNSLTHTYVMRGTLFSSSDTSIGYDSELYLMSADASSMKKITGNGVTAGEHRLSPDGESVYVLSGNSLVSINTTSGTTSTIASDITPPGVMGAIRFSLSSDGSLIAMVRTVANDSETNHLTISVIDLDTNESTDLWNLQVHGAITAPIFSTDNSKLYYVVSTLGERTQEMANVFECVLYELDVQPGTSPTTVVNITDLLGPACGSIVGGLVRHPSENTIFFLYDHLDGSSRIYSYSLSEGTLTPTTPQGESVLDGPIVTTTDGVSWLAYVVVEPLSPSTPYEHRAGGSLSEGWFAKVIPLP